MINSPGSHVSVVSCLSSVYIHTWLKSLLRHVSAMRMGSRLDFTTDSSISTCGRVSGSGPRGHRQRWHTGEAVWVRGEWSWQRELVMSRVVCANAQGGLGIAKGSDLHT